MVYLGSYTNSIIHGFLINRGGGMFKEGGSYDYYKFIR